PPKIDRAPDAKSGSERSGESRKEDKGKLFGQEVGATDARCIAVSRDGTVVGWSAGARVFTAQVAALKKGSPEHKELRMNGRVECLEWLSGDYLLVGTEHGLTLVDGKRGVVAFAPERETRGFRNEERLPATAVRALAFNSATQQLAWATDSTLTTGVEEK